MDLDVLSYTTKFNTVTPSTHHHHHIQRDELIEGMHVGLAWADTRNTDLYFQSNVESKTHVKQM